MILHSALSNLMTQADAARELNVTRQRINQLIKANKLAVYDIGGVRFVDRNEVEARLQVNNSPIDSVKT